MDKRATLYEARAGELIVRFYDMAIRGKYFLVSLFFWATLISCGLALLFLGWRFLGLRLAGMMLIVFLPVVVDSWLKTAQTMDISQSNQEALVGFRKLFGPEEQESLKPLLNQLENYLFKPSPSAVLRIKEMSEEVESRLGKIREWSFYRDLREFTAQRV